MKNTNRLPEKFPVSRQIWCVTALALIMFHLSCQEKEEFELLEMEGFIMGFDPCTIRHNYRIGYVIIAADFSDTLVTYNLSDRDFTMPASVGLNSANKLYTIPYNQFEGYMDSGYFPVPNRYDYPIKVSYRRAMDHELTVNLCSTDLNMSDFLMQIINNQIIVVRASNY